MAKWLWLYAIYTFSTKPDPCHYTTLLNVDVLNFYLTLDLLQSDCLDLVSKWRGHTVAPNFLLRSHCQTFAGCLETILLCFIEHATPLLSWRERREKRVVVSKRLSVYGGHFKHKFWQFWADPSWQLITLLNKPSFSLLCANAVVR